MMLLIDAGNNACKWALHAGDAWQQEGQFNQTGQPLGEAFEQAWSQLQGVGRVVAANVAGKGFAQALRNWTKQAWELDVEFLTPRRRLLGLTNAYTHPQRLGADRWAAMLAAHAEAEGAVCVVDCGTAITIDAINGKGVHQGGLILPGLSMMRRSLVDNTQGIPESVLSEPAESKVSILAVDTPGAVAGAALYAAVAFIDRVTADLAAELREPMSRLITGGDALLLLPLLSGHYRHEPRLVLHGLLRYAEQKS